MASPSIAPLLARATKTAVLVGALLVALNQGEVLAGGQVPASLWWRIPLTFLVPFLVSLHAGALASRRRR